MLINTCYLEKFHASWWNIHFPLFLLPFNFFHAVFLCGVMLLSDSYIQLHCWTIWVGYYLWPWWSADTQQKPCGLYIKVALSKPWHIARRENAIQSNRRYLSDNTLRERTNQTNHILKSFSAFRWYFFIYCDRKSYYTSNIFYSLLLNVVFDFWIPIILI